MEKNNQNDEFLQSSQWREFQVKVGRKTHFIEDEGFSASIIEHILPIVGKYLYVPRGPVFCHSERSEECRGNTASVNSMGSFVSLRMTELISLAKKENAGWVRIDPASDNLLDIIKENIAEKIVKAPHDMQPKELFVIDITKSSEQLLSEMKPKTRYNIGMAQKKGVIVSQNVERGAQNEKFTDAFLKLTKEMALRNGITAHPENYYRKMIESLPSEMMKIYAAEYEGKIIAANLVLFFDETATYLHGASSSENRNVMAPFLLQWQAILDAKKRGCTRYDFGGISTNYESNTNVRITNKNSSWSGITDFKLGFSPNTTPVEFPGSYDIIVNPRKYAVYRGLQRAKAFAVRFRR